MDDPKKENTIKKVNEYIYITEASKLLGVTLKTLKKWGDSKKIPVYYNPINSYRMYKREELEEFLNEINKTDFIRLKRRLEKRYLSPRPD